MEKTTWWEYALGILGVLVIGLTFGTIVFGGTAVYLLGFDNTTTVGIVTGAMGVVSVTGFLLYRKLKK